MLSKDAYIYIHTYKRINTIARKSTAAMQFNKRTEHLFSTQAHKHTDTVTLNIYNHSPHCLVEVAVAVETRLECSERITFLHALR